MSPVGQRTKAHPCWLSPIADISKRRSGQAVARRWDCAGLQKARHGNQDLYPGGHRSSDATMVLHSVSHVAQEEKVAHVLLVSGAETFADLYPGGHRAPDATMVPQSVSHVAQEEKVAHVLLVSRAETFVDLYPGGHRAPDATVVLHSVSHVAQEETVAHVLLVSGAETFATAARSRFPLALPRGALLHVQA